MRIISKRTLIAFWTRHASAKAPLESWYLIVKAKEWKHFAEVRQSYSSADQVKVASGRIITIFNAGGNNDRILTAIHYNTRTVFVLRVLTHAEYNKGEWKRTL